jgi:hypothetical protein
MYILILAMVTSSICSAFTLYCRDVWLYDWWPMSLAGAVKHVFGYMYGKLFDAKDAYFLYSI